MNKKKRKAQAVLETALAFVMMCLFFLGIINIWLWADTQIVKRQKSYNSSRLLAGTEGSGFVGWSNPDRLNEASVISNSFN